MILVILGAAIFVSCVYCWGDMVAIRRVNAQVEQNHHMLESLRSKLMQDNYDYEANSAEAERIGKTTGGELSASRDTGGPTTESNVTRRFAIVNNSDSTVSVSPSDLLITSFSAWKENNFTKTIVTTASAMTTTVTAGADTKVPIEFVRETFRPRAHEQSQESGVGMESLFDDLHHLLNQTEDNKNKLSVPAKPTKSLSNESITLPPEHVGGKLTLKNIEDLEFKFLRVKEGNGYRRKEGEETIIVTAKDGLFSQIKLPKSRRQYMASETETDK